MSFVILQVGNGVGVEGSRSHVASEDGNHAGTLLETGAELQLSGLPGPGACQDAPGAPVRHLACDRGRGRPPPEKWGRSSAVPCSCIGPGYLAR